MIAELSALLLPQFVVAVRLFAYAQVHRMKKYINTLRYRPVHKY